MKNAIGKEVYKIYNKDDDYLGYIRRKKIGKLMRWCFFPYDVNINEKLWFTKDYLKEITSFLTSLYRKAKDKGIS